MFTLRQVSPLVLRVNDGGAYSICPSSHHVLCSELPVWLFFSLFDCFSLCLFVLLLGTFAISNGGSFREKLECVVEVYDGRACSICSYCYCLPLPLNGIQCLLVCIFDSDLALAKLILLKNIADIDQKNCLPQPAPKWLPMSACLYLQLRLGHCKVIFFKNIVCKWSKELPAPAPKWLPMSACLYLRLRLGPHQNISKKFYIQFMRSAWTRNYQKKFPKLYTVDMRDVCTFVDAVDVWNAGRIYAGMWL